MSHFVYRLASLDGEVLYVGQTCDVERRVREHRAFSPWARNTIVTHEALPTREDALRREREVIEQERPSRNVKWNGSSAAADLVTLSVRVPRATADALKVIAGREDRAVAAEIRRLIRDRVDAESTDNGDAAAA